MVPKQIENRLSSTSKEICTKSYGPHKTIFYMEPKIQIFPFENLVFQISDTYVSPKKNSDTYTCIIKQYHIKDAEYNQR